jgi:hypothetical protein
MNLPSDESGSIRLRLSRTGMPPAAHSQQLVSQLTETHPDELSTGLGGVLMFIDPDPDWEDLLPLAIHLARQLDAPLQLAALPAADGTSRLEQVRSELVNWDYRTVPRGLVCVESSAAAAAALSSFPEPGGRLLIITRGSADPPPNATCF